MQAALATKVVQDGIGRTEMSSDIVSKHGVSIANTATAESRMCKNTTICRKKAGNDHRPFNMDRTGSGT